MKNLVVMVAPPNNKYFLFCYVIFCVRAINLSYVVGESCMCGMKLRDFLSRCSKILHKYIFVIPIRPGG